MRFLADESCDSAIVGALRDGGYAVVAVSEIFPQLAHSYGRRMRGVILVRYPAQARGQLAEDVVRLAKRHGKKLAGCFVVIQPGRVRIHRVGG